MSKITFCIPSKNNLRYLKGSIKSIQTNSTTSPEIIVYLDADNDGTEKWLIENNITYLKNESGIPRGIAYGYNRCIEAAKTEVVCMFHADMVMGKHFDTNILKHLTPKSAVAGTRIEPPLHPSGPEKIVQNFGMYPEDFKAGEFNKLVEKLVVDNKDKTTKGIFAPWAVYRQDVIDIGLHDETLHSYHEDSDIFNRFVIAGFKIVQAWDALVYHLTCRGGQFQDGIEKVTSDPAFHLMKRNAFRNYVRKWRVPILHDQEMYPILAKKYTTAFIITNCTLNLIELLEPWCDEMWVDCDFEEYVVKEQEHTQTALANKFYKLGAGLPQTQVSILFDGTSFAPRHYNDFIQNIPFIVEQTGQTGMYNWDRFVIRINNLGS